MKLTITPEGPFDFYRGLKDPTREPFGLTECLEKKRYNTIISNQLVTIQQEKKDGVLTVEFDRDGELDTDKMTKEIKYRFGLLQNLKDFYYFIGPHSELDPIVRDLRGLTMFQKSSPFEALVTAIADQQLNVSFATTLKRRLIQTYGRKFKQNGIELWTFPTCENLAELKEDALRPLQYSHSRSRFIIRLARTVLEGDYPLEQWFYLDDSNLIQSLMQILGVGRWTAEYVAMVGFNRCNIVPAADIGLQRAIKTCYRLPHRPGENEVRTLAENWHPWRGLVTYYLWHAFD